MWQILSLLETVSCLHLTPPRQRKRGELQLTISRYVPLLYLIDRAVLIDVKPRTLDEKAAVVQDAEYDHDLSMENFSLC